MREATATIASDKDNTARRDLMSILVRARQADLEKDRTVYAMTDRAMVDQVVCGGVYEADAFMMRRFDDLRI